jgi:hypothetical protein
MWQRFMVASSIYRQYSEVTLLCNLYGNCLCRNNIITHTDEILWYSSSYILHKFAQTCSSLVPSRENFWIDIKLLDLILSPLKEKKNNLLIYSIIFFFFCMHHWAQTLNVLKQSSIYTCNYLPHMWHTKSQ